MPDLTFPDPAMLDRARRAVRDGLVLGLSTDTVWGVAADPFSERAVDRIYERKGRPAEKAVQVLCATEQDARRLMNVPPGLQEEWARLSTLWPGAFTAVVPASRECPAWLVRDGKVGLRVPASPFARAVLQACGGLLAGSSLNPAGEAAASNYQEAAAYGVADELLPGPPAGLLASTVYDVVARRVLREGVVPAARVSALARGA